MGEVVEHLIEHGHNYHDVINTYTIDQVWLFYRKSIDIGRKLQHDMAVMFGNCMALPLGDKKAVENFNKFLKALLPEDFKKALEKEKSRNIRQRPGIDPLSAIGALGKLKMGVPIENAPPQGHPRRKKPPASVERPPIPKPIED